MQGKLFLVFEYIMYVLVIQQKSSIEHAGFLLLNPGYGTEFKGTANIDG